MDRETDCFRQAAALGNTGYVYIPEQCQEGSNAICHLHVAFHGCLQTIKDIGTQVGSYDCLEKMGHQFRQHVQTTIVHSSN